MKFDNLHKIPLCRDLPRAKDLAHQIAEGTYAALFTISLFELMRGICQPFIQNPERFRQLHSEERFLEVWRFYDKDERWPLETFLEFLIPIVPLDAWTPPGQEPLSLAELGYAMDELHAALFVARNDDDPMIDIERALVGDVCVMLDELMQTHYRFRGSGKWDWEFETNMYAQRLTLIFLEERTAIARFLTGYLEEILNYAPSAGEGGRSGCQEASVDQPRS